MKKTFFMAILIATTSSSLFAQVSFGPKIGVGYSIIKDTKVPSGETKTNTEYAFTPQIGGVLNIGLGEIIAIRPELMFNQRATKINQNMNGVTVTGNYRVSYLELPVNIAAGIKAGPGKLELFAGPAIALCFGGKAKLEANGYGQTFTQNSTIKAQKDPKDPNEQSNGETGYINPLNVSLNFGIGYKFDNGLLLQAGYNLGLSNINAHYTNSELESKRSDYITKSSSFNLGVGFLFSQKTN